MPCRSNRSRRRPSAIGERQMLPVQISRTEAIGESVYRVALAWGTKQRATDVFAADGPFSEDLRRFPGQIDDRGRRAFARRQRLALHQVHGDGDIERFAKVLERAS